MSYAVYIIGVDGKVNRTVQPKTPDYKQLNAAVGGMIQTVVGLTSYDGLTRGTCYANEEGLLKGMEYNDHATTAWFAALNRSGKPFRRDAVHLVGPVIFYAKLPSGATVASAAKSPKERREG